MGRDVSDLISRCKLFNKLATVQTLAEAYAVIQGMEPEDAEYVRHGRWIREYIRPGVFKYIGWTCDQCGFRNSNDYAPSQDKYCKVCGAKMDKKEGEQT